MQEKKISQLLVWTDSSSQPLKDSMHHCVTLLWPPSGKKDTKKQQLCIELLNSPQVNFVIGTYGYHTWLFSCPATSTNHPSEKEGNTKFGVLTQYFTVQKTPKWINYLRHFTLAHQGSHSNWTIFLPSVISCLGFTASASYSAAQRARPRTTLTEGMLENSGSETKEEFWGVTRSTAEVKGAD